MAREVLHPDVADISLDAVLGVLSDPIRRDVPRCIVKEGLLYCGGLVYSVVKSTLPYHLKVLRLPGLMHIGALSKRRRVTRRDHAIEQCFPGPLKAIGLPPGKGCWEEQEIARPGAVR